MPDPPFDLPKVLECLDFVKREVARIDPDE